MPPDSARSGSKNLAELVSRDVSRKASFVTELGEAVDDGSEEALSIEDDFNNNHEESIFGNIQEQVASLSKVGHYYRLKNRIRYRQTANFSLLILILDTIFSEVFLISTTSHGLSMHIVTNTVIGVCFALLIMMKAVVSHEQAFKSIVCVLFFARLGFDSYFVHEYKRDHEVPQK